MGTPNDIAATLATPSRVFLAGLVALCLGASALAAETQGDKAAAPTPPHAGRITVLGAASSRPAIKEAAGLFTAATGIAVDCSFGGTGALLNQIRMEHFGDLFVPASDDFMDKAEKEALVELGSRRVLCRLLPVICVAKGNPKQIKTLKDLTQPGLRVAAPAEPLGQTSRGHHMTRTRVTVRIE